jgi:Protein of unknown function (DUF3102)
VISTNNDPAGAVKASSDSASLTVIPIAQAALAEHAAEIRRLGKRVIGDVLEIGRRLAEVKKQVGRGDFLPWIGREFGWSEDTAERFIALHVLQRQVPQVAETNLPISALYLLAAPSTPPEVPAKIIERAEAGEALKVSDVRSAIEEAKPIKSNTARPQPLTEEQKAADRAAMRDRAEAMKAAPDDGVEKMKAARAAAEAETTPTDNIKVETKTEVETSIEADDPAVGGFTTAVAELVRLTRKQPVKRFAKTAIGTGDLAYISQFLGELATLLDPTTTPPPTNAKGRDVETEPSVEPPVQASDGNTLSAPTPDFAARVADLVATFPADGGIPPFLLRTSTEPPSVPQDASQPLPPAPLVPRDLTPTPPSPAPALATPPLPATPPAPSRTQVAAHYLPAHRDPWPANWKKLDAAELVEPLTHLRELFVVPIFETMVHAETLNDGDGLLEVLRKADRAEHRASAPSAAGAHP